MATFQTQNMEQNTDHYYIDIFTPIFIKQHIFTYVTYTNFILFHNQPLYQNKKEIYR